jgi:hypothetical protein
MVAGVCSATRMRGHRVGIRGPALLIRFDADRGAVGQGNVG